jgi:hypothetical protein
MQLLFKKHDAAVDKGLHSNYLRNDTEAVDYAIFYNPVTRELTYADANAAGGSGSAALPTTRGSVYGLTDSNNTGVGRSVFASIDQGVNNTAFGNSSLTTLTNGSGNTSVGKNAGSGLTTGSNNTLMGFGAGSALTTGEENTLLGLNAGNNLTSGSTNIVIGRNATASSGSVANEVTLGGTTITNTRIRGTISVGNLTPNPGTLGQVLTSQGAINPPQWSSPVTQVQTDWNAVTGLGVILNKPTIPSAQVQPDWNASSGLGQILNKPTVYTQTYIGTTTVTFNRASASQTLVGVSISGNAGTVTNGVYTNGSYGDPSWLTSLATDKLTQGTALNNQVLTWSDSSNKWVGSKPENLPYIRFAKASDQMVAGAARCAFGTTSLISNGMSFGSMASTGVFTFSSAGTYQVVVNFNTNNNIDAWGRVNSTDTPKYMQCAGSFTKISATDLIKVNANDTFDIYINASITVYGSNTDTTTTITFIKIV